MDPCSSTECSTDIIMLYNVLLCIEWHTYISILFKYTKMSKFDFINVSNACMYGVRCCCTPCDTTPRALTPQECILTSTPMLTTRCAYTSQFLFLPRPAKEHHVWHVVAQSLWHCHAQAVQGQRLIYSLINQFIHSFMHSFINELIN